MIFILLWFGAACCLTFWPFNFTYQNSVTIPTGGGLHFRSPSIAYIRHVPKQLSEMKNFSISTVVTPDSSDKDKGGVLFGYCYDHIQQNFLLMQKGSNLGFYLANKKNARYIWIRDIFKSNQSVWIAITYDGEKVTILKNGTVKKIIPAKNLDFSGWNNAFPFVLANTGIGTISWSGAIYSLDIFDSVVVISNNKQHDSIRNSIPSVLSLSFPRTQSDSSRTQENLSRASIVIPARFDPPAKGLISNIRYLFGKWEWDSQDFFLNVFFFMPLGFLLRPILEKSTGRYTLSFWLTLIIGLTLTITIETIQILLPDRDTSIMDVLANSLGTIIGSLLFAIPWIRNTIFKKVEIK